MKYMRSSIIQITVFKVLLVFVLTACSIKPTEWYHPKKSKNAWRSDIFKCKSLASVKLARQLDIANDTDLGNTSDLHIQLRKYDSAKILDSYSINCMTNKGYYKFPKNN